MTSLDLETPLHCPLCDYNLHGLPGPRCPECGYAFDWDELRIAIREKKSWFLEHAKRRLMWSFVRTAALTYLPRRLWTKVNAGHRSAPGRLAVFAIVCMAWVPVASGLLVVVQAAYFAWTSIGTRNLRAPILVTSPFDQWWFHFTNILELYCRAALNSGWQILLAVLLCAPFVSSFALNVFGTTLRRAGVKRIHAARAIVYAWCPFLLTAGLLQFALGSFDTWRYRLWNFRRSARPALDFLLLLGPVEVVLVVVILLAWSGWCVRQSVKHYLRLPQATLTATAHAHGDGPGDAAAGHTWHVLLARVVTACDVRPVHSQSC